MIPMNKLPHLVRMLCMNHEAWIVGGAARVICGLEPPPARDFDVLVPHWQWGPASKLIPRGSPANSFGGFKVTLIDDLAVVAETPVSDSVVSVACRGSRVEVDVWQGDVGWLLAHAPTGKPRVAVQPITGTVLGTIRVPGLNAPVAREPVDPDWWRGTLVSDGG